MHLILYLIEKNIEAYYFNNGILENKTTVDWSDTSSFIQAQSKTVRISLVLDTSEEDIETEFVPFLLPWEKTALLKRFSDKNKQKGVLAQRFIFTGHKKIQNLRKVELLITQKFRPTKNFTLLLAEIEKNQLYLTGLYSASGLLQEYLFKQIKTEEKLTAAQLKKPILMFAKMNDGDYRQCLFNQGFLGLTRLVPYDVESKLADQHLDYLMREARLASRFIFNQGLLDRASVLNYVIVDVFEGLNYESVKTRFVQEGLFNQTYDGDDQFLITSKIPNKQAATCFFPTLATRLEKKPQKGFYTLGYIKTTNAFHLARAAVILIATLVFLALLVGGVYSAMQHYFISQKADLLGQTEHVLEAKKNQLLKEAIGRDSVVDVEAVAGFTETLDRLNQQEPYGMVFEDLSALLAQHPKIKIDQLSWKPVGQADSVTLDVTVRGQVHPFEGQYLPMNALLEDFKQALAEQPGVRRARIIQQPYNQEQARNFRFNTSSTQDSLTFGMSWQQQRSLPAKRPAGASQ